MLSVLLFLFLVWSMLVVFLCLLCCTVLIVSIITFVLRHLAEVFVFFAVIWILLMLELSKAFDA